MMNPCGDDDFESDRASMMALFRSVTTASPQRTGHTTRSLPATPTMTANKPSSSMLDAASVTREVKQKTHSRPRARESAVSPMPTSMKKKAKNKGGRGSRNLYAGAEPLPALSAPPPDMVDTSFLAGVAGFSNGIRESFVRMKDRRLAVQSKSPANAEVGIPEVNTITVHLYLRMSDGSPKFVDQHMMSSLLDLEDVKKYNMDTIGRQPVLEETDFNGAAILSLRQDKAAGNNSISLKVFNNLSLHVTGPKTLDDLCGIAEYSRGLVEKIKRGEEGSVMIESFHIDLINTSFSLGRGVDLKALYGRLEADEERSTANVRAMQVTLKTDKHAGVRYSLFVRSVESSLWPFVKVFDKGSVLIGAKRFDMLATAYEHVTRFALAGARGSSPSLDRDEDALEVDDDALEVDDF